METIMKTGPSINRHRSKQNYATPKAFMDALRIRFGHISWDLAADATNHQAFEWFDEQANSLLQPWHTLGEDWLFLNPPFGDIRPWAKKCSEESKLGAKILFLVPAAVGSNWFKDYICQQATVFFLSPRLKFDGKNPFPKDCILCKFNRFMVSGFACWRWDSDGF